MSTTEKRKRAKEFSLTKIKFLSLAEPRKRKEQVLEWD
jgi:hypothetical protein